MSSWSLIGTDIAASLCFGVGVIKVQAKQSRGLAACYVGSPSLLHHHLVKMEVVSAVLNQS